MGNLLKYLGYSKKASAYFVKALNMVQTLDNSKKSTKLLTSTCENNLGINYFAAG